MIAVAADTIRPMPCSNQTEQSQQTLTYLCSSGTNILKFTICDKKLVFKCFLWEHNSFCARMLLPSERFSRIWKTLFASLPVWKEPGQTVTKSIQHIKLYFDKWFMVDIVILFIHLRMNQRNGIFTGFWLRYQPAFHRLPHISYRLSRMQCYVFPTPPPTSSPGNLLLPLLMTGTRQNVFPFSRWRFFFFTRNLEEKKLFFYAPFSCQSTFFQFIKLLSSAGCAANPWNYENTSNSMNVYILRRS